MQSDRARGHERKAQGRRGELRLRDFERVGPDHSSRRERKCFQVKSGWPPLFELIASIGRETEFTKFVGEAIAIARARHISRQGRVLVPVSCHARCNRSISWGLSRSSRVAWCDSALEAMALLTRLLVAHFQRARSRASAVVLTRKAASTQRLYVGTRAPLQRTFFLRCLTEHSLQIQNLSTLQQRNGHTDKTLPR